LGDIPLPLQKLTPLMHIHTKEKNQEREKAHSEGWLDEVGFKRRQSAWVLASRHPLKHAKRVFIGSHEERDGIANNNNVF